MMSDNKNPDLEKLVGLMKENHNQPGEIPRDRMWLKIEQARSQSDDTNNKIAGSISPWWRNKVTQLAAAAAAVLVIGFFLGRMSQFDNGEFSPAADRQVAQTQVPVLPEDPVKQPPVKNPGNNLLYQKAADDLFGRADILLTDFKVTPCQQQDLAAVPDWAGGMLVQTRLLLNTPVAQDTEMKKLLWDLELILAQIVGLDQENCMRDMAWIRDAMSEKSTLQRLRLVQSNKLAPGQI